MGRMFANGLGDRSSIQSRVISKTQKMVLELSLLNTHHYKVLINSKMEFLLSPTPRCSSY